MLHTVSGHGSNDWRGAGGLWGLLNLRERVRVEQDLIRILGTGGEVRVLTIDQPHPPLVGRVGVGARCYLMRKSSYSMADNPEESGLNSFLLQLVDFCCGIAEIERWTSRSAVFWSDSSLLANSDSK